MLSNPEYALIGAILIDTSCLDAVCSIVSADDFFSVDARAVFEAACRLQSTGNAIDPVTVKDLSGVQEDWLASIVDGTPTAAHALDYAKTVHKSAQLRVLQALGGDLELKAMEPGANPAQLIGDAQAKLEDLSAGQAAQLVDSLTAASNFVEYRSGLSKGRRSTVPSGFPSVDEILGGGFIRGGLYIIAARPGVGKTAFGLIMADMASRKWRVLFVSLEMSETELTARRVANISGVGSGAVLHNANLPNDRLALIGASLNELSQRKLTMNRCASATVAEIGLMARSCKAELVVVDYLGLIQPDQRGMSRYEITTKISNDLKSLARSLDVPVVCLAQLNRQSEARTNKRPMLSDLRDSGSIEQDADGVLLLYRPALFWEEKPEPYESQPFEIQIAKNRHGPVGAVTLQWYANNGRFTDKEANSWT